MAVLPEKKDLTNKNRDSNTFRIPPALTSMITVSPNQVSLVVLNLAASATVMMVVVVWCVKRVVVVVVSGGDGDLLLATSGVQK